MQKKSLQITKQMTKNFIAAFLAGIFISIGALAYLCCDIKYVGAVLFTIGLFSILVFNLSLFTGHVCFTLENKPIYLLKLFVTLVGNFLGTFVCGKLFSLTRLVSLQEKCIELCNVKLSDSLISLFILAIFCNILIFVAVYGFKRAKSTTVKILALFFGVVVFVVCGLEHCVADMFYFTFSNLLGSGVFLPLLIIVLGNIVGGLFIPVCSWVYKKIR